MPRIDSELLYSRKKGCAIDAHAYRSSICATNAAPGFGKCTHDLFTFLLYMLIRNTFLVT